ncbi:probable myosin-binding protein 6 [Andrographis paniculata]|uniref:probable myosin-binding protein 6 n=1 Tax=Andrographis paniculata TaxID=175694 RepID=UPI0021E6EDFB|nr:probable myosin-binding protein 6 [Andrographis paniculata]
METVDCSKHLSVEYEFGCRFVLFGSFQGIYKLLAMLLLFGFGLKVLYSDWFAAALIRCFRDLIGNLKMRYHSKEALVDQTEELKEKSNSYTDSDEIVNSDSDSDEDDSELFDLDSDGDFVTKPLPGFDIHYNASPSENNDDLSDEKEVSTLREMLKLERQRANAARAELVKERAAAATAAEEAMAMILRLQQDKSAAEMELIQYKRLAEEKQIHDQEVIQSLQWLVWRQEHENFLLEDELRLCRHSSNSKRFLKESDEDDEKSFSGNLWETLENVYYSSLDAEKVMTP